MVTYGLLNGEGEASLSILLSRSFARSVDSSLTPIKAIILAVTVYSIAIGGQTTLCSHQNEGMDNFLSFVVRKLRRSLPIPQDTVPSNTAFLIVSLPESRTTLWKYNVCHFFVYI